MSAVAWSSLSRVVLGAGSATAGIGAVGTLFAGGSALFLAISVGSGYMESTIRPKMVRERKTIEQLAPEDRCVIKHPWRVTAQMVITAVGALLTSAYLFSIAFSLGKACYQGAGPLNLRNPLLLALGGATIGGVGFLSFLHGIQQGPFARN